MDFMKYFVLILVYTSVQIRAEICEECICEESSAECYINKCSDNIVRNPNIEVITIHGFLCDSHRTAIIDDQNQHYVNTIFFLMDDICGNIPNCR